MTKREELKKNIINSDITGVYWVDGGEYNVNEDKLVDYILSEMNKLLDCIAEDQGWEESRDIYADAFGLPLKYPKLMEEYKKRNHIKGRIVLDCQSLNKIKGEIK